MSKRHGPGHVVVDGSNIATEGRSLPSLAQLNDAVLAFMSEHPDATVTVVVDATFGHRIDKSETKEFDDAVANNELVAPPAGAVGRGDAFVLGIADKADACILSNDSFQEFHGDYEWLFDEGRLIGGKPVPHVGWVFVNRVPVRGPVSRKATKESSRSRRSGSTGKPRVGSKEASQPMPVPSAPPPTSRRGGRDVAEQSGADAGSASDHSAGTSAGGRSRRRRGRGGAEQAAEVASDSSGAPTSTPTSDGQFVNDLGPFIDFVEHHPVGTSVKATVESYSSHGAYVTIGDVRGYVPLRLMTDPPPRSAREVLTIGDGVTVVVAAFAPGKRSIDCALPHMATGIHPEDPTDVIDATEAAAASDDAATPPKRRKRAAAKRTRADEPATADEVTVDASEDGDGSAEEERTTAPAARSTSRRRTASKQAPAKKSAPKKAASKRAASSAAGGASHAAAPDAAPARDEAPTQVEPVTSPATSSAAKQPAAKKAAAKKTAPKKSPAKKAPAKKAAAKKTAAKKAPAKKAAAKKTAAKKTAAKKAPAKKTAARKSPAKKSAARKSPGPKAPSASAGDASPDDGRRG